MTTERQTKDAQSKMLPLWWAPVELGVEYEDLLVEGEDERADELREIIASGYALAVSRAIPKIFPACLPSPILVCAAAISENA